MHTGDTKAKTTNLDNGTNDKGGAAGRVRLYVMRRWRKRRHWRQR